MNLIFAPKKVTKQSPAPTATLRIQSSAQGVARAIGWGRGRLAMNLIFTSDFIATPITENVPSGKGPGNTTIVTGYNYSCSLAGAFCEGPIVAAIQGWSNKAPESITALGFTIFNGTYTQTPWGFLISNHPGYAQNFRGLAYAANSSLQLGTTATLPNLTFDIQFPVSNVLTEFGTIGGSPYKISAQYFDIGVTSVTEEFTVPFGSPYQVQASHPQADTLGIVQDIGNASGGLPTLPGSAYSGVFYTDSDPIQFLTKTVSGPTTGYYTVTAGGLYTFSSGDAGEGITIADLAISPGVSFAGIITGDLTVDSAVIANLSNVGGAAVGGRISGEGVPPGAVITQLSGGSAVSCSLTNGSTIVGVGGGTYACSAGTPVTDSQGHVLANTTVTGSGGPIATLNNNAVGDADESFEILFSQAGNWSGFPGTARITLSTTTGISVGDIVEDQTPPGGYALPPNLPVVAVGSGYVDVDQNVMAQWGAVPPMSDVYTFHKTVTGTVKTGDNHITNLSAVVATTSVVVDQYGYLPAGTTISAASGVSLILSQAASGNSTTDVLSFPNQLTMSLPALESGSTISLKVRGAILEQVCTTPQAGQFSLAPNGDYTFASADSGKSVEIVDIPDANPADVIIDFLTNIYYGIPYFDPTRLGDLSTFRTYCVAAGLWVSPIVASQTAGTQLLQDLMTACNSEFVLSGSTLTVVPYGDKDITANGVTYTAPSSPIYSITDADYLNNEATNAASVSSSGSPDPVVCTRLDPSTQINDIQVEYLDRGNAYNPVIAEAQDDGLIQSFGLKSSGSKQLHILCDRKAALMSAHLQLGRQQVRNIYAFTLDRKFILLDPMDIIALNDVGLGLVDKWVRIREITENSDRSLSIIAEECLIGTGSAPQYGHAAGSGYAPNFNVAPGSVN